jgi:hypothetical protein
MPPVLDPTQAKVDGLAFLGLSLARKNDEVGHPASATHQTAFDLNEVQDRQYEYLFSSNDDGWLVGGGEPPESYKLAAPDSAHVEIMRIGTYEPRWGGLAQDDIVQALRSGAILIPDMRVVPTAVVANGDVPPELEIRFDMVHDDAATTTTSSDGQPQRVVLPVNWQLRFVHNQLFKYFTFPSRFCPGAFHSTILRKAEFRSPDHKAAYFAKCAGAVEQWRQAGPQPLLAVDRTGIETVHCQPGGPDVTESSCTSLGPFLDMFGDLITPTNDNTSGIYLFRDRNTITHYFAPNFFPDTAEKIQLVQNILAERWDETSLSWRLAEEGLLGGSAVKDNDQAVGDAAEQGQHDGDAAQGRDDVPDNEKSKQSRRRRQRQLPVVLPKSTNHRGSSLYQKLVVAARGGSKSSSSSSSVPSDTDKKKDRRHRGRGRPRSQRPAVFTSAGGVEGGGAKLTTPRSSGLFHLRRTTPHGIVEEIPATTVAE